VARRVFKSALACISQANIVSHPYPKIELLISMWMMQMTAHAFGRLRKRGLA
jgi:hypothetical protein